jgi:putative sugar O-methyltransferase
MWNVQGITVLNYLAAVDDCLIRNEAFGVFKSNAHYTSIVGMSSPSQAEEWVKRIREKEQVHRRIEQFKQNDIVGKPALFDSKEYGLISPNTLRYINSLCDIHENFGNLNDKDIVEIGVGYGGLCHILSTFYELNSYRLVDLPNVVLLATKYLNQLGVDNIVIERNTEEVNLIWEDEGAKEELKLSITETVNKNRRMVSVDLQPPSFDLFISEFCLSEMDDEKIDNLYDQYIQFSKNIYIFSNLWDEDRKEKLLNKLCEKFDITLLNEFPIDPNHDNYIIMGKSKEKQE